MRYLREGVSSLWTSLWALRGGDSTLVAVKEALNVNTTLTINGASAAARTSDDFICATMDWWPTNKCDYGVCAWTEQPFGGSPVVPFQDLNQPLLRAAAKELSPFILRLGGSLQDNVTYEGREPCVPVFSDPSANRWGFRGGCLTRARWKEIGSFCEDVGCKLVFGLNGLVGRTRVSADPLSTQWVGDWDESNARQLMQYSKEQGIEVVAWELGNELGGWNGIQAKLSPETIAGDFKKLRRLVEEVYGPDDRPLVMGPDNTMDEEWYPPFLAAVGDSIDAVNIHLYALGAGSSPDLRRKIMDPNHTEQALKDASGLAHAVANAGKTHPMWMGESGGAYNSGQNGTTNRFVASFWSLSELGIFARAGFSTYCRQTFLGGNYGLLDKDTLLPNPDFFAYLLFKRLMGPVVLDVSVPASADLKAFAHCTKGAPGSVTLLLLNFNAEHAFEVSPNLASSASLGPRRSDYVLTSPGALQMFGGAVSHLNGQPLQVGEGGAYPKLLPKEVDASTPLIVPPTGFGFYVFPDANAPACKA